MDGPRSRIRCAPACNVLSRPRVSGVWWPFCWGTPEAGRRALGSDVQIISTESLFDRRKQFRAFVFYAVLLAGAVRPSNQIKRVNTGSNNAANEGDIYEINREITVFSCSSCFILKVYHI